jgi:hypothetical protein
MRSKHRVEENTDRSKFNVPLGVETQGFYVIK